MTTPLTTLEQAARNQSGVMTPLEAHVSAINGTSPGPASGITYDVAINEPSGSFLVSDYTPADRRWSDDLNVTAAPVGSPVICYNVGKQYTILFAWQEQPVTAQCSQSGVSQILKRVFGAFRGGGNGS